MEGKVPSAAFRVVYTFHIEMILSVKANHFSCAFDACAIMTSETDALIFALTQKGLKSHYAMQAD